MIMKFRSQQKEKGEMNSLLLPKVKLIREIYNNMSFLHFGKQEEVLAPRFHCPVRLSTSPLGGGGIKKNTVRQPARGNGEIRPFKGTYLTAP